MMNYIQYFLHEGEQLMPKVSVIIPAYNVEKYISKCLESVIHQTFTDIEIIVINDYSTDNTKNIICYYISKDKRIILLNNEQNRGASYSRNRGLDIANGDYIMFVDSDDYLDINAVDELYNESFKYDLDILYFDGKNTFENEKLKIKLDKYPWERNMPEQNVMNGLNMLQIFEKKKKIRISVVTSIYKKHFLDDNKLRFFEGITYEDVLFYLQSITLAKKTKYLPKILYYAYVRENSVTTNLNINLAIKSHIILYYETLNILDKFSDINKRNTIYNFIQKYVYHILVDLYKKKLKYNNNICINFENSYHKRLYSMFKEQFTVESDLDINNKDWAKIFEAKNIIIYGAGHIGKRVMKVLVNLDFNNLSFAISDISSEKAKYGIYCYQIDDLSDIKDESVVIVAATEKYEGEMLNKLKQLQFKNIVTLSNKKEY